MNYTNRPVYNCAETDPGRSVWAYYGPSYEASRSPRNRRPCRYGESPASTVARRNERERKRVRLVNLGFAALRQHVPYRTRTKRASKVETLRAAILYIKQLQRLLAEHDLNCRNEQSSAATSSFPAFLTPSGHHYVHHDVSNQQDNFTQAGYFCARSDPNGSNAGM